MTKLDELIKITEKYIDDITHNLKYYTVNTPRHSSKMIDMFNEFIEYYKNVLNYLHSLKSIINSGLSVNEGNHSETGYYIVLDRDIDENTYNQISQILKLNKN